MGEWVNLGEVIDADRERVLHGMDWKPAKDTGVEQERHEIEIELAEGHPGSHYWRAICWCGWSSKYSDEYVPRARAENHGNLHLRAMEDKAEEAPEA